MQKRLTQTENSIELKNSVVAGFRGRGRRRQGSSQEKSKFWLFREPYFFVSKQSERSHECKRASHNSFFGVKPKALIWVKPKAPKAVFFSKFKKIRQKKRKKNFQGR